MKQWLQKKNLTTCHVYFLLLIKLVTQQFCLSQLLHNPMGTGASLQNVIVVARKNALGFAANIVATWQETLSQFMVSSRTSDSCNYVFVFPVLFVLKNKTSKELYNLITLVISYFYMMN